MASAQKIVSLFHQSEDHLAPDLQGDCLARPLWVRSRPEDWRFMETSDSSKGMGQKPNVSSDGEHQNSWGPPKMVIGIGSLAICSTSST